MRVVEERARLVASVLAEVGVERILALEERLDPQFKAVNEVSRRLGKGVSAIYSMLVALVSYKLSMRGEEWWMCFSRLLLSRRNSPPNSLDEVFDDVEWFINKCRGSVIARESKLARVRRLRRHARPLLEAILRDPTIIINRPDHVASMLSRALNTEPWKKTIVFSIKMAYYALREPGSPTPFMREIPMPVDVRVACLTYSSRMVEASGYLDLVARPRPAQEAWRLVSRLSGIPVMHLDSIAWLLGWMPRDLDLSEARARAAETLSAALPRHLAARLAEVLISRRCS